MMVGRPWLVTTMPLAGQLIGLGSFFFDDFLSLERVKALDSVTTADNYEPNLHESGIVHSPSTVAE